MRNYIRLKWVNSIRKLDRLFVLFEADVYNKLDVRTLYNAGTMIRIIKKGKKTCIKASRDGYFKDLLARGRILF